jgi:hypothetical protein
VEDLRRRIEAARLPSKELVEDRSQGVQLATIQELATRWGRVICPCPAWDPLHLGQASRRPRPTSLQACFGMPPSPR